jgi:plastocyanin
MQPDGHEDRMLNRNLLWIGLLPLSLHAAEHEVGVISFNFVPSTLDIRAGDTVHFVNRGGLHNVVADDGRFRCALACEGDAGNPSSERWSFSLKFDEPGDIPYFCEVHGTRGGNGMAGLIRVGPAP